MARFRRYIAALTGGTHDVVLPIGVANPMAREHVLSHVDELLGSGAEEVGAAAADEASLRLADWPGPEIKASLVVADDLAGGWTNRYTTEASMHFPDRGPFGR